jgi:glutamine amidotransferase
MRATILDYGAGNLHSLAKALAGAGAEVAIETDPRRALATDVLLLPGVGSFSTAAACLAPVLAEMRAALAAGLPCLGICLGMQLLFERSEEGPGAGLAVLAGEVTRLRARRVPQMGWNALEDARDPLFVRAPLPLAYYAHSFACRPADPGSVIAESSHEGDRFAAAVRRGRTVGVQFHPEKSSRAGVEFVAAFLAEAER